VVIDAPGLDWGNEGVGHDGGLGGKDGGEDGLFWLKVDES
jgi:hypothetical protein